MQSILVDSNIILDIATRDPRWLSWSAQTLNRLANRAILVINPIIYSEVSIGFTTIEAVDAALPENHFRREALPYEAGFLAGKCFVTYRRRGGARTSPLPDFYIGAHAAIRGYALLSRDSRRYRTYFPQLEIIDPA